MRIQILRLPEVVVDEGVYAPFALIVDRYSGEVGPVETAMEMLSKFRDDCGASALLVAEDTVEVLDEVASEAEPVVAEPLRSAVNEESHGPSELMSRHWPVSSSMRGRFPWRSRS